MRLFAILSDGAGGHANGAMASDIVVRTASLQLQRANVFNAAVLEASLEEANDVLNEGQDGLHSQKRMHATAVALWIDADLGEAMWAHVGDSRLYRIRHGRTEQLTKDDSVVQHMVDAGYIKPEEARHHPRKNQLLAALGIEDNLQVHVTLEPEYLEEGDAFLLCSDGWWDHLEPGDIERTMVGAVHPQNWLDAMADIVARQRAPNQDNYTAIAVWVGDPTEVTRIGPLDGA